MKLQELPPFSPTNRCRKCGHDVVGISFHGRADDCSYGSICRRVDVPREHMMRHCRRCGYRWIEAPIDAAAAEPNDGSAP